MATLKTKILHRNDTTANWTANSSVVLSKGEIGIEWITTGSSSTEGKCKIKVGDGFTTWANLDYFGGSFRITGNGNTIVGASIQDGVLELTKGNRIAGTQTVVNTLTGNNNDNTIPTSKAVQDALTALNNNLVSSIKITDDDVVNVNNNNNAQTGTVTYEITHAKKGPSNGYTSDNTTTSISGSGATGTIKIPQLSVDSYGHVTAATDESVTITMPTIPGLSKGSVEGSGNVITDFKVNGHTITPVKGMEVYSKTEIDNAIAAATNAAVVLKGTLGTGGTKTALPTASSTTLGDAYKVITSGTYAGQTAKAGDMFICYESGASTYAWMLIPSGDDIEDSWRQIKVNNVDFLGNGTSTSPLNIAQESNNPVTVVSGNNGTVTISHASKNVNSLTANGRTYVTGLTFDGYGHITGYTTGTETVTNTNTSHTHKAGTGLSISGAGGTSGEVTYSLKTASTAEIGGIKVLGARTTAITTNSASNTSGRYYGIEIDSNGKGFVNVPWTDTNTTYSTVTSGANGLAHKADVANGIYMRVGDAEHPSWNQITVIDGGGATDSGYGSINA